MAVENKVASDKSCGYCCTKLVKLGVTFGQNRILEDVNLHVHCGQFTAVIGPNGAGKTTLLKAILGEVPHTGHVHFIDSDGQRPNRPFLGYVPQKLEFDATAPVSVRDLFAGAAGRRPVWLGIGRNDRSRAKEVLDTVQAGHLIDRKLGQLSGGELQRVLLAMAITPVPNLLLLDEPVSGVDLAGIELFYKMVSQLRRDYHLSIILVSHDLSTVAQFADRIVFLNRTVIADGTPRQVLSNQAVRQAFALPPELALSFPEIQPEHKEDRGCISCNLEKSL
ncbi:MAG: metal ABC transporter ATP-binding protein [Candidatus Edwardsbacteria bacterium]|nr:metal ABC transporter ATP-binding protein [Candidatus Edwardsbacteria bacterium]MBU1577471.1 metal ABC transporter ATP-binding protein [Candidatus Edwardsbacteria bacterium]MBU2464166.1 metal ABC transporter ATP-binding protein [Candidatus Edwardsbacteria bacterium]MBU2593038.1 metal ABC transporter ATP-binding protein [Candidatus Edwardsbacteria bacterium]